MELRVGSELSGYTVVRRLGGGGMGVVYLVRHRERETLHAVKLLRHVDPRLALRLRAEGRLQSELAHPNVVRVTEVIEVRGQPGLVMDYVSGPTLAALLARTGLALTEVDALARRLLGAIAAAHGAGWVHRDLKPENVLLAVDGDRVEPRVTDFGLAAATDAAEPGTFTRLGAGTRRYMSLEQLTGSLPEPGMDVFALGALLFELIEGVPAFPTIQSWKDALECGRYPEPARADVPDRMRDAVRSALTERRLRDRDAGRLLERWEAGTIEPGAAFRPETLAAVHPAPEKVVAASGDHGRVDGLTWAGSDPGGSWLPAERDGFVGRAADLDALAASTARVVTIHGTGGIGKTRLATRFARQSRDEWPGGVWSCDLSEARDTDGIVEAVARALGVVLADDHPVLQLGRAIAGRGRCLVVLDNFEQVVAHAADTIGIWADRAPEARFVTTSRIVLGIPGEQVVRLEPLPSDEAVALFVARARAGNPSFDPTADPEAIERLVALLDGLPLAIELCAARVRILLPARIVERMDDRFRVLSGGRGRGDRHATLRAALDWSWELLQDWERAALVQCSVFAGRFGLDAAEHVIDVAGFPAAPWPIDILQSLVDESLVRAVGDGSFELLQSIRDYGAAKLGADATAIRLRHAAWYADLADAADARDRPLHTELDNLVAAARTALQAGQADLAARAALGAARVLELRGPYRSAYALLDEIRNRPDVSPLQRARVLGSLGRTAHSLLRREEARSCFTQALAEFRALGERWHEGATLASIGAFEWETGRPAAARTALEQALELHRARGDRGREGRVLNGLASMEVAAGHLDEAWPIFEASLALVRQAGTRIDDAIVLANMANLHALKGRHRQAIAVLEQAIAIHRESGDRKHEARALTQLGNLYQVCGELDRVAPYFEAATAVYREVGDRRSEGMVLASMGPLLHLQGRHAEAERVLDEALVLNRETGNRRVEATVLANQAVVYGVTGRRDQATERFAAALAIYRDEDSPRAQGVLLGRIAEFHIEGGALTEARTELAEAERLLRPMRDPHQMGTLACLRALMCAAQRDTVGSRAALDEAEAFAVEMGAEPGSMFGGYLDRARVAVGARQPD